MELRGVTLKRAGEIIGGDEPLSKRTISSYIAKGDLEAYGERKGRRVTMRSIDAYLEGKRSQWHEKSMSAGNQGAATPPRPKTRHGSRTFPDSAVATTFDAVSIVAHQPKRGSTHS